MYIGFHVKLKLFLIYFTESWSSLTDFRKMLKYRISWKSAQWDPMFHADGKRGMTKLTVAFRNFANATKNEVRSSQ